jgi:hypothetical protein
VAEVRRRHVDARPFVYRIPIEMVRTSRDSRRRAQKLIKVEETYVDGVSCASSTWLLPVTRLLKNQPFE